MSKPIIGVSGTFGSGKDTISKILEADYNFLHVSTSDIVREKSMERHGSIERNFMRETANYYRKEQGGDYFVQESYKRFQSVENQHNGVVISGIRSIGEVEAIHQLEGTMVMVDAPIEIRYQRMIDRQRDTEAQMTLDEFKAGEETERRGGRETDQNIDRISELADVHLDNSGSYDEFVAKVHELVRERGLQ